MKFLAVAGVLIVLGIVLILLQPGGPDPECAAPGEPSSGFVVTDDPDCQITIESWAEIQDYETSPKPFRIAGLAVVIAGLVVGVVGLFQRSRGPETAPQHE